MRSRDCSQRAGRGPDSREVFCGPSNRVARVDRPISACLLFPYIWIPAHPLLCLSASFLVASPRCRPFSALLPLCGLAASFHPGVNRKGGKRGSAEARPPAHASAAPPRRWNPEELHGRAWGQRPLSAPSPPPPPRLRSSNAALVVNRAPRLWLLLFCCSASGCSYTQVLPPLPFLSRDPFRGGEEIRGGLNGDF